MKIKNKKSCFRKKLRSCKSFFTLIELVVAMAVFSVIMLVMMQFFGSAQQAWSGSSARSQIFENAKLAMDMMSRDLQSAVYIQDLTPFANFSNEDRVAFVSATPLRPNDECLRICEVQYKLDSTDNSLYRSVVGDVNVANDGTISDNSAYNYSDWPGASSTDNTIYNDPDWHKVIPYVVSLDFQTFKLNGTSLDLIPKSDTDFTNFPDMIIIKMSILDKDSYTKYHKLTLAGATTEADEIKKVHQRTFTKIIFLSDQGQ